MLVKQLTFERIGLIKTGMTSEVTGDSSPIVILSVILFSTGRGQKCVKNTKIYENIDIEWNFRRGRHPG